METPKNSFVQRINSALPNGYDLVPDIGNAWRWWSVRWGAFALGLMTVREGWDSIPKDWTAALPPWVFQSLGALAIFCLFMAGAARGIQQPAPKAKA